MKEEKSSYSAEIVASMRAIECDLKEAEKVRDKHSFSGQARLAGGDGREAYTFVQQLYSSVSQQWTFIKTKLLYIIKLIIYHATIYHPEQQP